MEEEGKLSYVKKVIHSLIVSTPIRMTVEALKRDYLSEEGSPVPFIKFGFKDIESFLHSIPDTVLVLGYGPMAEVLARTNEKTAHIQNLVQSQKKPNFNSRNPRRRKPKFCYPSERSNIVFINEQHNSHRRYSNNSYNHRNDDILQSAGYHSPPRSNSYREPAASQQSILKEINGMSDSFAKFKILNVDDESSSDEENNFQMCLPDKVVEVQLDDNANAMENNLDKKPIPKSPTQYVSSDEGCDEDAIPAYAVDERVLNFKYSKAIKSFKEDPIVVPSVVPQVVEIKKEPVIDYESSNDGSDSEAIPAYAVDDRVLSVEYPKDAVRFNQSLPGRDIHKIIQTDSRIQVQLVTVASPHSFYFWVNDEQYDNYKAMSTNMQRYYENIDNKRYTIPLYLIMAGHLAAYRGLIWQRVQVLNTKTGSKKNIEVEHIDTGERIWVHHTELNYLCKEFATLPAQCWYGRLSYVMPRQGLHFSMDASNYFYDLVSYRRLYAKVDKINEKDNAVHMILVDPDTGSLTKNINIALIESGLVRRCYKP